MTRDDGLPPPEPPWNRGTISADDAPTRPDRERTRVPAVATARFEPCGELGRGGMGEVIAATDAALDRVVAIKQALSIGEDDLRRFDREARITAQLEHPSIVPIYDVGRDEQGRPFYIMRRIEGDPLSARLVAARDVRDRLALVPHVLAAVDAAAFAHARRIIHRDIKPGNILIGPYGETLLIDWGLARHLDEADVGALRDTPIAERLTRPGRAYGTVGYLAPEQARGESADARADVYALGATLWTVLAGEATSAGMTDEDWLERAAAGAIVPPLATLASEVPAPLVAIVGKAMAVAPADRYPDAAALAGDLRAFLAGQLVAAHRYTALEHVTRFVRRHRVAVAIAAAASVALAAVGAIAVVGIVRARDRADAARVDAEAGERLASERADALLIDRASLLATRDPTRAVATLRRLPANSPHTARARDVAAIAAASGVSRGKLVHRGGVRALALSPDGQRVASFGDDQTIRVLELATGGVRTVASGAIDATVVWTDGGKTITYGTSAGVFAVDAATGERTVLDAAAMIDSLWVPAHDDRVRYFDRKRGLVVEHATRPRTGEVVLARDVTAAEGSGDRVLVEDPASWRIIDGGPGRVLRRRDGAAIRMALAATGTRAAVALADRILEWDLDTGAERVVLVRNAVFLFYANTRLHVARSFQQGALDELGAAGLGETLRGSWSTLAFAHAERGTVVATSDGTLAMLGDDARPYLFPRDAPGTRVVAGRPGLPVVAVGMADGTIRWWDLRTMLPRSISVPTSTTICKLDADRIYAQGEGLIAIPRAGGAVQTLDDKVAMCIRSPASTLIAYDGDAATFKVIDVARHISRTFAGTPVPGDEAIYFVGERDKLFEVVAGEAVLRWTTPGDILRIAGTARWIAAAIAGPRLARFDRTTGATTDTPLSETPRALAVAGDGTVWFALGRDVFRTTGTSSERAATLPALVTWISVLPDGTAAVLADDASLWTVSSRGAALRADLGARSGIGASGLRAYAHIDGANVAITYLDTGERLVRRIPGARAVQLGDRDRTLAVQLLGRIDVYSDPVPADPSQLAAWLDDATNAALEPGSDVLTWR